MTKRLIDIDDELLVAAQRAAGQDSIKGTVTEALNRLVEQQRRREQYLVIVGRSSGMRWPICRMMT